MTIDTSNPDETPWSEMDRATKAEILMQWNEGAQVQFLSDPGDWRNVDLSYQFWCPAFAYRIKPKEERVEPEERQLKLGRVAVYPNLKVCGLVEIDMVDGEIDFSVHPRWVNEKNVGYQRKDDCSPAETCRSTKARG